MLYEIRCDPINPLYGAVHDTYTVLASAGYARCFGCTHRYAHAPPRSNTSQYRMIFIPLYSMVYSNTIRWCIPLYSMVWDWRVSRA